MIIKIVAFLTNIYLFYSFSLPGLSLKVKIYKYEI